MQVEGLNYVDGYRSSYKYHLEGTMNLILSAPHGGNLMPEDLPDRSSGICFRATNGSEKRCKTTVVRDTRSDEFTENVANELYRTLGVKPFVVIGKWHRKKIDFNRELVEGTLNHPEAILAYEDYHHTLNQAVQQVKQHFGQGLLIDLHGHAKGDYTMLGYMLSKEQLNHNDLSSLSFQTSIEALCRLNRNEIIRGQSSFGTILEEYGFGTVYPSLKNPKPESHIFFAGGYITDSYSSKINAIQSELPYDVRAGPNNSTYAVKYAQAVLKYMEIHHLLRCSSPVQN